VVGRVCLLVGWLFHSVVTLVVISCFSKSKITIFTKFSRDITCNSSDIFANCDRSNFAMKYDFNKIKDGRLTDVCTL